jgi:hypothetical protein
MFIFKYGAMPMTVAEKSLRLFAKEVMPALKELKPEPLSPVAHRPAGHEIASPVAAR